MVDGEFGVEFSKFDVKGFDVCVCLWGKSGRLATGLETGASETNVGNGAVERGLRPGTLGAEETVHFKTCLVFRDGFLGYRIFTSKAKIDSKSSGLRMTQFGKIRDHVLNPVFTQKAKSSGRFLIILLEHVFRTEVFVEQSFREAARVQ